MIKRIVAYTLAVSTLCAGLFSPTAFAKCSNDTPVLLFPAWFHGLKCEDNVVKITSVDEIWIIVMNILQWLIIAGGYVALYFIIWGGFKYITSTGDPQKVTSAKNTIVNAVIGLVIVLASVAIIRTIQASIKGSVV